jgi:hypothetical protein
LIQPPHRRKQGEAKTVNNHQIRALLVDLGPLTGASVAPEWFAEALTVLASFETSPGELVRLGLLADPGPSSGATDEASSSRRIVDAARGLGVLQYFDPPDRHITAATLTGAAEPDRRVVESALQRLGVEPLVGACFLATASATAAAAAKGIGMHVVKVDPTVDSGGWSAVPLLVAHLLHLEDGKALLPALNLRLKQRFGLALSSVDRIEPREGHLMVTAISPHGGGPSASEPMTVVVALQPNGDVATIKTAGSPLDSAEETRDFVRTLEANHQIGPANQPLQPGVTHTIELGPDGEPIVKRNRFSIF